MLSAVCEGEARCLHEATGVDGKRSSAADCGERPHWLRQPPAPEVLKSPCTNDPRPCVGGSVPQEHVVHGGGTWLPPCRGSAVELTADRCLAEATEGDGAAKASCLCGEFGALCRRTGAGGAGQARESDGLSGEHDLATCPAGELQRRT